MARLPDQIGKYNVVERIGKGGMGMVYKAEHPTLDRHVILKKLNISGDQVVRERFRREAEIMIDFRTDYVVDVYDHFKHASNDYIVLEYIDGISLDELLSRERYLQSDLALYIIRDCFRGLDYVHGKGVVHRDMKPGNVIVGRDGSVKLLDFGIASRVTGFDDELTREGMTLGTVAYIAPEQIEQSRSVDRRADLYSTGATLYEMVTGRKPFTGGFTPETVNRIQRGKYRHPRRVNPRISPLASRVIRRCMRRKPSRRFQTAADVVKVLDEYFRRRGEADLRGRLAVLAGGTAPEVVRSRRGKRLGWVGIVAAGLGLLAVAAAVGWVTGVVQPFVVGNTHALARFEVRLRKSDRAVGEHAIRTRLLREIDGETVEIPVRLPLLRPITALETPDYIVLRSRLLTVPAGRYATTIEVEDTTVRANRSLEPLAAEAGTQLISAQWDPPLPAEVRLEAELVDAYSGTNVDGATVETMIGGSWVAIELGVGGWRRALPPARTEVALFTSDEGPSPRDDLISRIRSARANPPEPVRFAPGDSIALRIAHRDYLTETIDLETDDLAQVARVRVELVPRPATVLINSQLEEAAVLVDDSDRIPAAGRAPLMTDLPPIYSGITELSLRPGYHRVEVRFGDQSDAVQLQLPPGGQAVLRLEAPSDRLDLTLVEETR